MHRYSTTRSNASGVLRRFRYWSELRAEVRRRMRSRSSERNPSPNSAPRERAASYCCAAAAIRPVFSYRHPSSNAADASSGSASLRCSHSCTARATSPARSYANARRDSLSALDASNPCVARIAPTARGCNLITCRHPARTSTAPSAIRAGTECRIGLLLLLIFTISPSPRVGVWEGLLSPSTNAGSVVDRGSPETGHRLFLIRRRTKASIHTPRHVR
jgi:hypothetical protein